MSLTLQFTFVWSKKKSWLPIQYSQEGAGAGAGAAEAALKFYPVPEPHKNDHR
jgi:hypothetical protein